MTKLQTRDRRRVEEKESWVDSLGEVETMKGGELAEDEELGPGQLGPGAQLSTL